MKKVLVLLVIFSSILFAKVNVVVSILPQETFVKKIGGDLVNVITMVTPGQNPHSYEPKANQMKNLSNANVYFYIGTEFESVWLNRFKNQNAKLKFVDSAFGVEKMMMGEHHHEEESHNSHESHAQEHEGFDPHIWTSPSNVKIIAKNIYDELILLDSDNKNIYEKNYNAFMEEINQTDKSVRTFLKDISKNSTFLVFHPSWGYFAKEYGLVQIAVEVEGKEPKANELMMVIKEAKEENVRAIFTQPEFSDKSAKIIANEVGIKVIKVSPLNPNWSNNLINMAKAIANK